jgi:RraA family protein
VDDRVSLIPDLAGAALRPLHLPRPASASPAAAGAREPGSLRVLLITEAAGGGSGRHVLDLSEGLLARGHDVHLIYAPGRLDRFFRDRLDRTRRLRSHCLPIRRGLHPADLAALWSIRRYVRAHGPFDVIHGHSAKGGALARLAGLGTPTPIVYTLHGYVAMDPGLASRTRRFYRLLEWVLSRATDRIIAVSPEERRFCLGHGLGGPGDGSRVVLIPNGVAPGALVARPAARRALGLDDASLAVGFIGRLVHQKAADVLIRALAEVQAAPAAEPVRLVMVGSGPLEGSLRELAARLGVAGQILWLGERDGRDVLPAFDVFVLPSRKEGLPYVLLEAMSAGLPIVATTAAGVEALVHDGESALIVPPDRPDRLAARLLELIDDVPVRRRLGRQARQRSALFTVEAMVERTLSEYRSCLGRSAGECGGATVPEPSRLPPQSQSQSQSHEHGVSAMGSVTKPRSAELHPGPGFRVRQDFPRPDPALVEPFRHFPTPDISDLLNRLYAMDPGIRCLTGSHHQLCGPACTVKVFPGDNLMVHKALDVARPGDIIVVDAGRSIQNAVLGDLVSAKARHRRIAGFVVDGLIRDLPSILPLDFPVFARGTTPIGPLHRGPGEINYPICCGGTVVNPGDLIVADAAGVIVVPREIAAELLERLTRHEETNRVYFEAVRRGEFSNQWVDRLLAEQKCQVLGAEAEAEAETEEDSGGWDRGFEAPMPGHGASFAGLDESNTAARELAPASEVGG